MDRNQLLFSFFDASGVGLEISPSYNPIVPKSSGRNIETLDHATAEELRHKYKDDPHVDISKIEDVDYVSGGGSIQQAIGKTRYYDYILASHLVEHLPDLLGFLKDCESLLKDDGVLVLAVPDKRFCFDVFQNLSSTGDLLQAHLEKRSRHSPGKLFDFIGYRAMRGPSIAWDSANRDPLAYEFNLDQAQSWFTTAQHSEEYVDIHAWRFTPSSFRLILHDLHQIGAIALREDKFHDTIAFEFFLSLRRTAPGCPLDRLTLAKNIAEEQKAIIA
jgi:SAM-dependent methyltransferase